LVEVFKRQGREVPREEMEKLINEIDPAKPGEVTY
jgi:Ca2+-binding EF-hand superfamily protein